MLKIVKCLIRKQFTKKEYKVKNILRMLHPNERKIMLLITLIFYFLFFLKEKQESDSIKKIRLFIFAAGNLLCMN